MTWHDLAAPTLADIEALALEAFATLPAQMRDLCETLVIRIEDFAEDEVLESLGIDDPFGLSGLYQGVDLPRRSVADPLELPPMVFLYRRPLLDEWAAGDMTLGTLVRHVLIHEIGHHFGLSDEDIARIEAEG